MTAMDYASRDKMVRQHTYASVRRRDGLPQDLFAKYWRDVHGPLCARLPGLGYYAQQHFDRDHRANLWPVADGVREIAATLDGAAEIGFATEADQALFAEAGSILYEDEANFIGEAVAYNMPHGAKTLVDRDEDGIRNGAERLHRVHVYMNRVPGNDSADWLVGFGAEFAASSAVQKLKLHLPEPYSNAHPAPPSPNVDHIVGEDRLNLAVMEIAFENARVAREFFSESAFQKAFARQSRHVQSIGAYLVTGVYTYVRDGVPTPAGLRGSSQAELIDAVGAANQLSAKVNKLFVQGAS
ncbi:EthD domain-containing protein [Bradyrhizobium sp. U87765 SZCCT0131]|uniref:EthD domain-containing protein n=1 Tax=unclassified Bradyrhizobium TaxID=2631580 RepID=UPI001BABE6FC|nr:MULTISPECIES: EthD domain-containing protein [unclassified Bradyrhizobium]MBR1218047.1 EthD domain-containing protein [Bradyrhizobium sp. U87765 SZCCT0131]MBR1261007.1 EthD domain-containing protein [Bradyrhizobium sp. U87765 SZCCT0134]MBR1303545.1 EthD domain-containing protein [Bradyrhizobium sp. U87765 SZCCT0110]MBR1319151.1 EthD domain-containing protein [Bradyrhizobium sp. U87765 SZCCT0109]MBR1347476.1 EthD domain-containing protein [Bradyrhizobium sp. U87765 SZCCT0048]